MSKDYPSSKFDMPDPLELTVLGHLSVVVDEVAADLRGEFLALAVGASLQVMTAMQDAAVVAVVGTRGKHNSDRVAVRHGHDRGSVNLGGRRVPVQR